MTDNSNILNALQAIPVSSISEQDWIVVGMALKEEGFSCSVWDEWSSQDAARYHPGECKKKWDGFHGNDKPVKGGTIISMAKQYGWSQYPSSGPDIGWVDEIPICPRPEIIDQDWVEDQTPNIPTDEDWNPADDIIKYLSTLFHEDEYVNYVTKSYSKDGKFLPANKGNFDRTAGQLIESIEHYKGGDISNTFGDYNHDCGAWIRFNPMDGKGVSNDNVTDYRFALVESDQIPIERQIAIVKSLNLPIACMVHSGGKSVHSIVRIDAKDFNEYKTRVNLLYKTLDDNGMKVDTQDRNPSRLSRMPGVVRGGSKQYLMETNIGAASWADWKVWLEEKTDTLPKIENLADVWSCMPILAPELIEGTLRQGHKGLLAGASKAGKSFLLMELCVSIAEGIPWIGRKCAQGRVLYVNLEVDRASCFCRFQDIYSKLHIESKNIKNIDVWNLRGNAQKIDDLVVSLCRRVHKGDYIAIIIDPIYKVITGDENNASEMGTFCNEFDKICATLGCAVVYCHHHSKGSQGSKRSMDRASGSGVFARDPDALLDMIELEVPNNLRTINRNRAESQWMVRWAQERMPNWTPPPKIKEDPAALRSAIQQAINPALTTSFEETCIEAARQGEYGFEITAWRIEPTLREFRKFSPINVWFDYPIHTLDKTGVLNDLRASSDPSSNLILSGNVNKTEDERLKDRQREFELAFATCDMESTNKVLLQDLMEYLGTGKSKGQVSEKTIQRRVDESDGQFAITKAGKKGGPSYVIKL